MLNHSCQSLSTTAGSRRAQMARPDMESFVSEPLTANLDSSERCANRPFCKSPAISRPGKKYCSDRCRLDGYVLRRARAMLDEVGIVASNAILQRTCD